MLAASGHGARPELDEPVTSLGFVASCTVSAAGVADVHLRLPTYFCAPNFAFLMVADAYDAVSGVPGVQPDGGGARRPLRLRGHQRRGGRTGRVRVQPSTATPVASSTSLRADFVRKAVLAGTDRVCRPLLAAGRTRTELAELTLGDVPTPLTGSGCAPGARSSGCPRTTTARCSSTP